MKLDDLLRKRDGVMTRRLKLEKGSSGMGLLPSRLRPTAVTHTVCGFCSTGCELTVHMNGDHAVNLTPSKHYPVNKGMACPKGWEALEPLGASDRATTPLLRQPSGTMSPVDWDSAMKTFVARFKGIQQRYGNSSVAWLGTGQITNEELAFLGALGKFGMGLTHGDGNTRQCMATAVTAYKESFGFDAPPFTYKDFEESDTLIFFGSNPCIAHPILWQRVLENPGNPEIIVVDPRRTETAMTATRHYAITPRSDLILLYGLANILIENEWIDKDFINRSTSGFENFKKSVREFTSEYVANKTGLSENNILEFANSIHRGKRVSFWWMVGINQGHEATRTAQAIINLALITGNIGKPGTGANSITGQCNAMGSRLFSNTSSLIGGRNFTEPDHRREVADIFEISDELIPRENSWSYDRIVDGIENDEIKGLWIIATNPSHSWINHSRIQKLFLEKLEFLVVQDMYHSTETAQQADLLLPAAGWGEKEGTFINSERRIGLTKKVAAPPGTAMSDFDIFRLVAHYWGCGQMFEKWQSPEAAFQILKKISRDRPCDFSGIRDYQMLDEYGGIQWPFRESDKPEEVERRLFEDGKFFHEDGRAKIFFEAPRNLPEPTCDKYPFTLLTGRGTSAQWHTQTRTGKSAMLRKMHAPQAYVEIHPEDARRGNYQSGQWVRVSSRRGELKAVIAITNTVQPRQVFIPMHYPEVNRLTFPVFDTYSRQPGYKACAVAIERSHQQ